MIYICNVFRFGISILIKRFPCSAVRKPFNLVSNCVFYYLALIAINSIVFLENLIELYMVIEPLSLYVLAHEV